MLAIQQFLSGLRLVPSGFSMILKPGIKRFVAIPLAINIILFSTAIWFGYNTINSFTETATDWLPSWLDWIVSIIWPLVIIAALIIVYYCFTVLGNLIAAPFNSLLSAKIEQSLDGGVEEIEYTFSALTKIAGRTIWSEIRKLLYQLKWLCLLLILSLIPGINLIAPFAWFCFAAWMLAINYVDYPMGNHDFYFANVKDSLKKDRMTALGLGSGILLLTLIPGLNFFAMPVGVVSASIYYVNKQV